MDKRTRVFNAMDKKPVDHVPVGFWYHFEGEKAMGEPCVQAHVAYVHDCDLDMVKIMCDSYFAYPVPETIREAKDWRELRPLGKEHPFIREQVERARRIVEEVGREMPVFYNAGQRDAGRTADPGSGMRRHLLLCAGRGNKPLHPGRVYGDDHAGRPVRAGTRKPVQFLQYSSLLQLGG